MSHASFLDFADFMSVSRSPCVRFGCRMSSHVTMPVASREFICGSVRGPAITYAQLCLQMAFKMAVIHYQPNSPTTPGLEVDSAGACSFCSATSAAKSIACDMIV